MAKKLKDLKRKIAKTYRKLLMAWALGDKTEALRLKQKMIKLELKKRNKLDG